MNGRLISSGSTFEKLIGYSRAVVDGEWILCRASDDANFLTQPRFETGVARYRWLIGVAALVEGRLEPVSSNIAFLS
jgi:hypothetical protein